MKLDKAIEILSLNVRQRSPSMPPDVLDALKLGIEALKVYRKLTKTSVFPKGYLLPGEDPE